MLALGIVIPVSCGEDVNYFIHGDAYSSLRRSIEELVRDVHERLESGEYKIDFMDDIGRFLVRMRDGLDVLYKVPLPWKGSQDSWRQLIVSLSTELDSTFFHQQHY